jgi:hypothetical protein
MNRPIVLERASPLLVYPDFTGERGFGVVTAVLVRSPRRPYKRERWIYSNRKKAA